jgi:hypothetical protein
MKAVSKLQAEYLESLPPSADEQREACLALQSLPDAIQIAYDAGCVECDCCMCVLRREKDFLTQKSGIEEAFDAYNLTHGTCHMCVFLPKFHPELNFIERIWGRMKSYIRLHSDNTFDTLKRNIEVSMGPDNLPLAMIRRFARGTVAYMIAYKNGLDIISADAWVKKHRQHRGVSIAMDKELDALYFPQGNAIQPSLENGDGENRVDIDRDVVDAARDGIEAPYRVDIDRDVVDAARDGIEAPYDVTEAEVVADEDQFDDAIGSDATYDSEDSYCTVAGY